MDTTGFEAALVQDGYEDIETKALRGDYRAGSARAPLSTCARWSWRERSRSRGTGPRATFAAGDVFTMDAGCAPRRRRGPKDRYLVGRRSR